MIIRLKCKDFDAWISFIKRIGNIGKEYIIKNDIYLAIEKNNISGTTVKIPGQHIIHDPLFDENDLDIRDHVYILRDVKDIVYMVDSVTSMDKTLRKDISYCRDSSSIYIMFGDGTKVMVADCIGQKDVSEVLGKQKIQAINHYASNINTFKESLQFPESIQGKWDNMDIETLIRLRDGSFETIRQRVTDKKMLVRIAKSVFAMSGASRSGNPIADDAKYSFILPNPNAQTGLFLLYAKYKSPNKSSIISIECIHKYVVLIYNEEE